MANSSLAHDSGDFATRSESPEHRFHSCVLAIILAGFGMLAPAVSPLPAQEPRPSGGEVHAGEVRAWEGSLTLPTYPWVEDINPKFWALEGGPRLSTTVHGSIVYPYTMQDHLLREKHDRTYKALFLENEYLRVVCLPELGGRIHSVLDKTEGEEMFHLNGVIKPGMIAMRGGWISGGIEWNTGPHGHTVTCLSPVNACIGSNPDGSAYLFVSNTEQIFRTRWTVRLTLRPGRSYLEEEIAIYNPTDGVHPYYFWNCTAFPNRSGTRFIFPMSLGTDHNAREFFRWPIHEGRDLTWLKNYETYASVFAVQCTHDFFGAYDVDADRGIAQFADHRRLGGKKAWTWGEWEFGKVAQQDLTDEDGPYIEVQSGPLPTQSDYGRLNPRQRVAWQEWWYPVHGLGDGFEFANREAAVNVMRFADRAEVRVLSTGRYPAARYEILQGEELRAEGRVDLAPNRPAVIRLSPAPSDRVPLRIRLLDAEGRLILEYESPLKIPHVDPPDPATFAEKPDAEKSADDWYVLGAKRDLATDRLGARRSYLAALERDPDHALARKALAVLDYEAARYDQALRHLERAIQADSRDGWAWFYAGVCHLALGRPDEAAKCAERASQSPETALLGQDLLGRAEWRRGEQVKALQAFDRAISINPSDHQARVHRMLALWGMGRTDEAAQEAETLSQVDPTALLPRIVPALASADKLEVAAEEARRFLGEIEFEALEAALTLHAFGMDREAAAWIRAACRADVPEEATGWMPLYYLARFSALIGEEEAARRYLRRAAHNVKEGAFASRAEELEILEFAVQENPRDAQAALQLGCLLAHLGQKEEAARWWRKAVELAPANSIAWRNLGLSAAHRNDWKEAEDCYRAAIAARPDDQTLYRDLAEIFLAAGRRADAITLIEEMPLTLPRRSEITILLAQALIDEGRHDACVRLLEGTPYFTNWEGQDIVWRLFNQAHIERGKQRLQEGYAAKALEDFEAALTYPPNLHVGRSNRPIEAPAQYWRGMALRALGREAEARQAWQAGAEGADVPGIQNEFREKCRQALQSAADPRESRVETEQKRAAAVSLSEDLPVYICRKIDRDLVITGKADDALWHTAYVAELRDATTGMPGRFATVARLLYNERFLYISFQCKDDYPWGTFTDRDDPIYEEECVEAFLCPSGKTRQYYEINVSPRGTIFDAFILNGRPLGGDRVHFQGLKEFTCEGLEIKVFVDGKLNQRGAEGWSAEYAIPFTSLPGADENPPRPGTEWRMNLFRIDAPQRDRPEFYAWSIPGAADFHRPWRFGTLRFE